MVTDEIVTILNIRWKSAKFANSRDKSYPKPHQQSRASFVRLSSSFPTTIHRPSLPSLSHGITGFSRLYIYIPTSFTMLPFEKFGTVRPCSLAETQRQTSPSLPPSFSLAAFAFQPPFNHVSFPATY